MRSTVSLSHSGGALYELPAHRSGTQGTMAVAEQPVAGEPSSEANLSKATAGESLFI